MNARWLFPGIGVLALLAGTGLWLAKRPPGTVRMVETSVVEIAPGALMAATFADASGQPRALAQFQDKLLVVNFWATWCAPCREEMPAFARLQDRWAARGVQFVGLANEDPAKVHPFGKTLGINYPLWTGGQDVAELSRRLGNRTSVLPHTAIIAPGGRVLETKVGPYLESELETALTKYAANAQQLR